MGWIRFLKYDDRIKDIGFYFKRWPGFVQKPEKFQIILFIPDYF